MNAPKRYTEADPECGMLESDEGEYIRYEDHIRIITELKREVERASGRDQFLDSLPRII